jgi:hypothetical protein
VVGVQRTLDLGDRRPGSIVRPGSLAPNALALRLTMPADAADKRARPGNVAARLDIRRAEAGRVLGLLNSAELPERARSWIVDGADSRNVRALAAAPADSATDGIRRALLAEIAAELGLSFAAAQDARTFQAEEIIRARSFNLDVGTQIYGLSNGYTDELVRRVVRFFARRGRR